MSTEADLSETGITREEAEATWREQLAGLSAVKAITSRTNRAKLAGVIVAGYVVGGPAGAAIVARRLYEGTSKLWKSPPANVVTAAEAIYLAIVGGAAEIAAIVGGTAGFFVGGPAGAAAGLKAGWSLGSTLEEQLEEGAITVEPVAEEAAPAGAAAIADWIEHHKLESAAIAALILFAVTRRKGA